MSPQQVPPLRNGATDIDSDSDYLGTPVDPPASCQPYVAEYPPLTNYYYSSETYDGAEYASGRSGDHLSLPASSEYGGPSPHHGLLLQTPYPATAPEGCSQQADTTIAAYPLITPSLLPASALNVDVSIRLPRSGLVASRDSSFTPTSQVDSPRTHYGTPTVQYQERDGDGVDCSDKNAYMQMYSKTTSQQSGDAGSADRILSCHIPWMLPYARVGFHIPPQCTTTRVTRSRR
ncbi:hypothetical protein L226DRAFT_282489 [Lentinus tigrinus ALCF2SS1-7]|uniref:uncharacterized protein n=1 Tax=Lentinus tigrinus ALCF2SS1-7 TaxID=1328758 RepID=UPI001166039A|nr:hypothetical protein L226DRAFT_282489 [Lentinus tigrinus ALCF2SS1-7]